MGRTRRKFTAEQKVAALRRHLVDREPVSDICEDLGIQVSQFYDWQKRFFEHGASAFDRVGRSKEVDSSASLVKSLQAKLQLKNEVLSELMEEYVALKKSLGEG